MGASTNVSGVAAMPRYAIWNNKGGVGKTFLTFIVATEYALKNEDVPVVVIDMCPQANVSEILLGGNGSGAAALAKLLAKTQRRTIGGYFDDRIVSPHALSGTETSVIHQVCDFNQHIPDNMYLVAGDPSLEIQSQAINQIAAQTLPANSWGNVHKWVLDLTRSITIKHPNAVFFIDCNPSFSSYTELALLAADRLIVPCTADGSSARAIDNVGQLLYGIGVPENYKAVNFATKAGNAGLALPSIHLVPLNRSTQYEKSPSKAFNAMYTEIKNRTLNLKRMRKTGFSSRSEDDLFTDIPDAHAVSVIASHHGLPLRKITQKKYSVHDEESQVRPDSLQRYKEHIDRVVSLI